MSEEPAYAKIPGRVVLMDPTAVLNPVWVIGPEGEVLGELDAVDHFRLKFPSVAVGVPTPAWIEITKKDESTLSVVLTPRSEA